MEKITRELLGKYVKGNVEYTVELASFLHPDKYLVTSFFSRENGWRKGRSIVERKRLLSEEETAKFLKNAIKQ